MKSVFRCGVYVAKNTSRPSSVRAQRVRAEGCNPTQKMASPFFDILATAWGHHLPPHNKTSMCFSTKKGENPHENSIDDRWKRLQRRRRNSGRYQDHDGKRRLRHQRHHGPDCPEHHRRLWHSGIHPRISGQSAGLHLHGHLPRCGENGHGVLHRPHRRHCR